MSLSEVKHLVMPGYEHARLELLEGETISAFLERSEWYFSLPTICVMNGEPVLRKDWTTTTITAFDNVIFYSRPHGGGGSGQNKAATVGSLVALIALAAFAPYIAGPAVLGFASGTFGFYASVAAITIGGGYLINTYLMPKPATNDVAQPVSQIFTINGAGNTANPFQPIPIMYGNLKWEPPYASLPWSDYHGNTQFLNLILCCGMGKNEILKLWVDDTLLWDSITGHQDVLTGSEFQICQPGEAFTLFPTNVVVSPDVDGQEFTGTTKVGWFPANPPGTTVYKIVLDYLLPGGLQSTNTDGTKANWTVHVHVQVQQIDDSGTPIGSITDVVDEGITMNTNQPTRFSEGFKLVDKLLPVGRYQVRAWRDPGSANASNVSDSLLWAQLRGYLEGSSTFNDVTVVGLRVKANGQLSGNGSKHFGVTQTRILPVWNGSAFVDTPTRNAFWSFYDAATNTTYGAGWPINKIDFQTIVDQATNADTRGDGFDYVFNTSMTFQEAFDKILQSNRAKTCFLGDILSCVRDEWHSIPQMLITDQQIVRGTLEVDYQINNEDNTDSVQLQFLNRNTWKPAQLQFPKDDSPTFVAANPAKLQIDGITDPNQVWRELQFWYKQSVKRRIKVRLDTEHDGRILRFGSSIRVQSHLPSKWGVVGEVISYNVGTHVLVPDRDITSAAGQHYIELRDKRGRYFGPVKASVVTSRQVLIDSTDLAAVETSLGYTIADALDRMDGADPPSFVWGLAGEISRNCIVLSGRPNENKVSLEMTIDTVDVHDDSDSGTTPLPSIPVLQDPRIPVISLLAASFRQGVVEPTLAVTWIPAPSALYYRVQISYDSEATWTTLSDHLEDPNITAIVSYANLRVRVAGVSPIAQGAWYFVDVTAPDIDLAIPIKPSNLEAGLRDYVMNQLQDAQDNLTKVAQQIAAIAAENDAAASTSMQQLRSVATNASASVTTLSTTVATNQAALASYQVTVAAHFGTLDSSVTTNASAIATAQGDVDAMFSLALDVNGYITGFESTNNGLTSVFQVIADKFVVAKPGVSGGAALPVFSIGTSGGVANIVIQGTLYADGAILSASIGTGEIKTVNLAATSITAGKMAASSITAANAALDTLAVQSLNIADAAVTVPSVNSFSGSASSGTIVSGSLSIDTTGLSGKSIIVYINCNILFSLSGFGASVTFTLEVNRSNVQSGSTGTSGAFPLTYALTITGTGSVMSVTAAAKIPSLAGAVSYSGVLFMQAAKR